jgi:hypothetical protein
VKIPNLLGAIILTLLIVIVIKLGDLQRATCVEAIYEDGSGTLSSGQTFCLKGELCEGRIP